MRLLLAALLLAAPAIAPAREADLPLMLIGKTFLPESPMPVGPDHPLFHRVALAPMVGAPDRVNASVLLLSTGTKREAIEDGLRKTLERMNLLAPSEAEARVRLTPRWVDLDAPVKVSFASHATATLHYTLTRLDTGAVLFDRDVVTESEAHGGEGSDRYVGNARTALGVNFASLARCLDKAAFGRAPGDCALTPGFRYQAHSASVMLFMPRF